MTFHGQRKKRFWEDFTRSERGFMVNSAIRSDAAKQARLDELIDRVSAPSSSTTFHTFRFERPDGWEVMDPGERQKFIKQARRDWKRSRVTKTVTRNIDGSVDVTLSRPRQVFETGRIESGLGTGMKTTIARYKPDRAGNLVQTFDFFKSYPQPEDAAHVFGVKFDSAFDSLPPSKFGRRDRRPVDQPDAVPEKEG